MKWGFGKTYTDNRRPGTTGPFFNSPYRPKDVSFCDRIERYQSHSLGKNEPPPEQNGEGRPERAAGT